MAKHKKKTTRRYDGGPAVSRAQVLAALRGDQYSGRTLYSFGELASVTGLRSWELRAVLMSLSRQGIIAVVDMPDGGTGYRLSPNRHAPPTQHPGTFRPPPRNEPSGGAHNENHEARRRRAAGLREVAGMIAGGKLHATIHDDHLYVNGQLIEVPDAVIKAVDARLDWVGDLVDQRFVDELRALADTEFQDAGLHDVALQTTIEGIEVCRYGAPLATLSALRVAIEGGRGFEGTFFHPGSHWAPVVRALRASSAPRLNPPHGQRERILRNFPRRVDDSLRDAALVASARLREDRAFVFDRAVWLESERVRLCFGPLRHTGGELLEVPFVATTKNNHLHGGLRLRTAADPLALVCRAVSNDRFMDLAWPMALIAYAELTCNREVKEGWEPSATRRTPTAGQGSGPKSTFRRDAGGDSPPPLSDSLSPIGVSIAYVPGHPMRLALNRNRSRAAEQYAHAAGITLQPDCTWVRPHVRGLGSLREDAELRFHWHAPSAVRAALA